jgi:hypothetical protein
MVPGRPLKAAPSMWLQDFLPKKVPSARILTYGYDSGLFGSESTATIPHFAKSLLAAVKSVRGDQTVGLPPCYDWKNWRLILF